MIAGSYIRTLDDKLRLAIPRPMRDAMESKDGEKGDGSKIFLGPGTESTIQVFSSATLERMSDELSKGSHGPEQRAFQRLFFSQVQPVEIDGQGRIRIPVELKKWAGLESEVAIVGARDRLELWDADRWRSYTSLWQKEFDKISDQAFGPSSNPDGNKL